MYKKLILMYHYIAEEGKGLKGTYPLLDTEFASQLKELKQRNFSFEKVSKIKEPVSNNTVYITFDDSTIDQYKYAMPVLEEMNIPAHFSIITNPFEKIFPLAHRLQLKLFEGNYPVLPPIDREIEKKADHLYHFETGMRRYCKYIYNIHLPFEEADKLLGPPEEKELEELKIRFMQPEHIKKINYKLFEIGCHTKSHIPLHQDYEKYFNEEIMTWEADMKKYCPDITYQKVFTFPLKKREGAQNNVFAQMFNDKYQIFLDHTNNLEEIMNKLYPDVNQSLFIRYDGNDFQNLIKQNILG